MPKRKKLPLIPNYKGSGRNPETHLIQKANPLLSLSETDMTLSELKILDVYLDRIDSHDEEKRTVQFEKGEIEKMLGVSRILKKDLEKRLRHLAQVVKIEDETKPEGFKLVSLFEEIDAWRDENGLWQISLTCTNRAKEYIFNIDSIGYLRYRLKNVINLTSRYSYILYLWLEHNRFRHSWEIDLAELKSLLQCTAESYTQFKRFNDLILKRCQKEILKKTDCRFSYEPIKKGRVVKTIRFTVETFLKTNLKDINENQITLEQWQTKVEKELWENAIDEFNFTSEQVTELREVLICIPEYKMPESIACYNTIDLRRYHYMQIKVAEIKRRANIKNIFSYLIKILKNDANIQ